MVSAAARSTSAATLVFVASVLLVATDAPAWCVVIALIAATWRVLVALGHVAPVKRLAGMRFMLGAITAVLVIAVLLVWRHRGNIERLLSGNESRIRFSKRS